MELFPLGTIIKVNNHDVCIIGYGSDEKKEEPTIGYLVVSYPTGFTSLDKVFFIPSNLQFDCINEGYNTISSKKALELLNNAYKEISKLSDDDISTLRDTFRKLADKGE